MTAVGKSTDRLLTVAEFSDFSQLQPLVNVHLHHKPIQIANAHIQRRSFSTT
jgi:hypothetical protein